MMQQDLNQEMVARVQKNSRVPYFGIKLILNEMYGLDLHDSPKGTFRFPIYLNEEWKKIPIETLGISERGKNCLRRAGYDTVYGLLDGISSREDLLRIRNCGGNTAQEIMEKIFIFQFNYLNQERRKQYVERIVELNEK